MQTFSGTVIHGKALARKIGFPTANIFLKHGIVDEGTYKINIILHSPSALEQENKLRDLFLGAGVYRKKEKLFEAHLLDFTGDLYGINIEIIILEKIRNNTPIHSLNELKQLIVKDIAYIKNNTFYGITFGTFDKFHPGHEFYLHNARKYCEKLITIVSTDNNVRNIKKHTSYHNQEQRKQQVQDSHISDIVYIGEENNHLKYIKQYRPDAIILGYDQNGFLDELHKYMACSGYHPSIITLPSFRPDIYKSSKIKLPLS